MNKSLPIFPLGIVVLPGNIQSLQIFEPRYLKMIKDVMRGDNQFVISLLSNSNQDISFKDKGTLVEIIDFNDLPNGLLGITVKGTTRVEISSAEINEDDYHVGQIFPISEPTVDDQALLAKFPELINVLSQLKQHPKVRELPIDINLSSTFLITKNVIKKMLKSKKGKIIKVWANVKIKDHAKEVLETLQNIVKN